MSPFGKPLPSSLLLTLFSTSHCSLGNSAFTNVKSSNLTFLHPWRGACAYSCVHSTNALWGSTSRLVYLSLFNPASCCHSVSGFNYPDNITPELMTQTACRSDQHPSHPFPRLLRVSPLGPWKRKGVTSVPDYFQNRFRGKKKLNGKLLQFS